LGAAFLAAAAAEAPRGGEATTPGSGAGRGCFQGAGLPPGRGSKVRARPSSRRGEAAAAARGSACARPAAAHRRRPPAGPSDARPQVVFFLWAPGFVAAGAGGAASGRAERAAPVPGRGSRRRLAAGLRAASYDAVELVADVPGHDRESVHDDARPHARPGGLLA